MHIISAPKAANEADKINDRIRVFRASKIQAALERASKQAVTKPNTERTKISDAVSNVCILIGKYWRLSRIVSAKQHRKA